MAKKNLLTVRKSTALEARASPPTAAFSRPSNRILLLFALVAAALIAEVRGEGEDELKGVVDSFVDIPCITSSEECGKIHSVKWYQNGVRIYVYSSLIGHSLPEGPLQPDRAQFKTNDTPPVLHISSVRLSDEGTYRCDVTYVSLKPACPISKTTHLKTLAKPNSPQIFLELPDSEVIGGSSSPVTGTTIGPFHENELITLTCSSGGGKPPAQVSWWNGSQALSAYFTEEKEDDGTGVGTSVLKMQITRRDLLTRYDCQVTHETLDGGALVTWVEIDVHVPPSSLELEGDAEVNEEEEVSLKCVSSGARPAAKITWYNGTVELDEQPELTREPEAGGTFLSHSTLTFKTSRFDDEEVMRCEASNEAMEGGRGSPLAKQTPITVFYAPVVSLSTAGLDESQSAVIVQEGASLRLECAFEANPSVNVSQVTWYHNGHIFRHTEGEAEEGTEADKEGENGSDDKDGRFHLLLSDMNRRQSGDYSCSVENRVGRGDAERSLNVSVLYAPEVRIVISPSTAVEHVTNVSLSCELEDANPSEVKRVRWFRDSQLIEENDEMSKLLEHVDRTDHRNYSCQAENAVGWGQVAEPVLLDVIYTPGRARITHRPLLIIKGQPVTLTCELDDPGNPPATEFTWRRGEFLFTDIQSSTWNMSTADLRTQDEYSCNARNAAGEGIEAKANIDVNAAPSFLTSLPSATGALETAKDISLTCQVECDPRCSIDWYKNGELLTVDHNGGEGAGAEETVEEEVTEHQDREKEEADAGAEEDVEQLQKPYSVKVSFLPANFKDLHFSSVVSTLRWNLSAWANKRLDRTLDAAKYMCRSSPNLAGIGVNSTTEFSVEYPPENINLSSYDIEIEEGQVLPSPITCNADGKPELSYMWTYDNNPVSGTNELKLDYPASRKKSGTYTCIATNHHGKASIELKLDVQYKPLCTIAASMEDDGSTLLSCEVSANPVDVDFMWLLNNETIRDNVHTEGLISRLQHVQAGGKYYCIVNNSLGRNEEPCVMELQGPEGALIAGFSDNRIIIIVVVVAAIIIVSVIVCIVIVLVMKRRGTTGKYCNPMDLDQRESPEGHSQTDSTKTTKSGKKAAVVTFKRVEPPDSGLIVNQYQTDENTVAKPPRSQVGPPGEGDRAFYENLPFHGLQPAPNKEAGERPVPAPRDYSPTKMRHIYQNLLLPLRSKPFKPLLPDLEYADVDFTSANQGQPNQQQQTPSQEPEEVVKPNVIKPKLAAKPDIVIQVQPEKAAEPVVSEALPKLAEEEEEELEAEDEPRVPVEEIEETENDAEPSETENDAELSETEIDAEPAETEIDAEPAETEIDAEPAETEIDAEPEETEIDADIEDEDVDAEPDVETEPELETEPEVEKQQLIPERPPRANKSGLSHTNHA